MTEAFVDTALNLTLGRLRRVVQYRHRPQDHDRRGRRDGPQAVQHPGGAGLHDARAALGRSRLVRQYREGPPAPAAGNRARRSSRACSRPSTGTERLPDKARYEQSSKKFGLDTVYSVSAIVACYKDNLAIPIMYERLKATFTKLNIDFEIIFVNDCSPDDSEEVIRGISRNDRRVIGISHSRNFGSQSAFRSGMEIATKNACVLLDGDLQDPPELIEQFVELWRQGYDVVYGRRVKREATLFMQFAYKAFYRIFDYFLVHRDSARRRRFFPLGQARGQGDPSVPRARPVPARRPGLCGVQADRSRLRAARADVRPQHQQPAQEPRLGQEGNPQLQQYAAEHHDASRAWPSWGFPSSWRCFKSWRRILFPDLVPPGFTTSSCC